MGYKSKTLFSIIRSINKTVFLPHIQRPFVWDEEQMMRLFDSLMRDYPIQTMLFWRTKENIRARRFMDVIKWDEDLHKLYDKNISEEGEEKIFVLDGQQRLQTLYALFKGGIAGIDGTRFAYMDVTRGREVNKEGLIHSLRFSEKVLPLPYFRLKCLTGRYSRKNQEDLAEEINDKLDNDDEENDEKRKSRRRMVRRNLSQIVSIFKQEDHFWIETLDGVENEYPYKTILDIFVRVNSGGTKLDAGDLMFATMKEGWEDIEEKIEGIVGMLNDGKLNFDKSFVLKCLVVALGGKAELTPEKFVGKDGKALLKALDEKWNEAEESFQQLRDFIFNYVRIYSDKVVRSYQAFVPLFDYLFHNPKPHEQDLVLMRAYHYKAQMFNWYAARTDNTINAMHTRVGKKIAALPIEKIKRYFKRQRRSTELTIEDTQNTRLRYIILNMIYVAKFGSSPFDVRFKGNEPHIDHIYPKSMLRSRLEFDTEDINHIGNYRYVGAIDNIRKRAELPESYFERLRLANVEIEKHLLIKQYYNDTSKLKFEKDVYIDFRDKRARRINRIARKIVNAEI